VQVDDKLVPNGSSLGSYHYHHLPTYRLPRFVWKKTFTSGTTTTHFLPCDTMLAWYMLWFAVCLSFSHKLVMCTRWLNIHHLASAAW